jgi:site-specific recombinase XerD
MKRSGNEAVVISHHINTFLNEYMPSQKTRSEHTIKSYDTALSLFLGFLETEKNIDSTKLRAECFNSQTIEEWLLWLINKRGCSPQTCNVRLASLRVFLSYLGKREVSMLYLSAEASQINRKKTYKTKVHGMSKDAVKALLAAPDLSTATGRRDLTLLVLMYGAALRIDEVLSLKVGQLRLDAKKPYVSVIGKRDKIRTLYLLPKSVAHIKRHLREVYGDAPSPESLVFGSRDENKQLSQTAISKRLKEYAVIAHETCKDVPLNLHAHQIRHAKASHWLEDGMNIVQISFLLGHEQLSTTMVYLDVTTEQETKALATLEDENEKHTPKKWKINSSSLAAFCGVKPMARQSHS